MDGWDHLKQLTEKPSPQGGLFLRLASDGDRVVGVFCGAPLVREVVWTGERYETHDPDNPAHRGEGKRSTTRVAVNFFLLPEGTMKVLEGSLAWFKDVLQVKNKYGLDRWSFEVQRHGAAGDPKTRFTVLPESQLDDAQRARIARTPLHDLDAVTRPRRPSAPAAPGRPAPRPAAPGATPALAPLLAPAVAPAPATVEGKVDAATATQIYERLRALQRPRVDAFLAELAIRRVRDLNADDVPRALAVLERLEGGGEASGEIDPFA
jgi:hypothetical protein